MVYTIRRVHEFAFVEAIRRKPRGESTEVINDVCSRVQDRTSIERDMCKPKTP